MLERRGRAIAVYCGSSTGSRTAYAEATDRLVERCAARGVRIVYGGPMSA